MKPEFMPFPKMARLSRECLITEKIDGTNATVHIEELGDGGAEGCVWQGDGLAVYAGSRTRWITPEADNAGFARWVRANVDQLLTLGIGTHRGEWWGQGIQRNYGLTEKRFSLFNAIRWCRHNETPGIASVSWDDKARQMTTKYQEPAPACCHVVPVLYRGEFSTIATQNCIFDLATQGSIAAPGFDKPEGIVCFHLAGNVGLKKTIEKDDEPKGKNQ